MPSLRHSSATLSSPRKPAITMRTFSSAEYNRRVARLISRTAFSASSECVSAFDLISAPFALKMSQKPSLPQSLQTVQLVLTGNMIAFDVINLTLATIPGAPVLKASRGTPISQGVGYVAEAHATIAIFFGGMVLVRAF